MNDILPTMFYYVATASPSKVGEERWVGGRADDHDRQADHRAHRQTHRRNWNPGQVQKHFLGEIGKIQPRNATLKDRSQTFFNSHACRTSPRGRFSNDASCIADKWLIYRDFTNIFCSFKFFKDQILNFSENPGSVRVKISGNHSSLLLTYQQCSVLQYNFY